jgi:cytochrome c oxidase accessory protein FixG
VKPIDAPLQEISLFEVRQKVYPRAVHGWFAAWRWALVWATQLLFYGGAWLTWNERQAVLFDIVHRKFYLFGLVFWPQDIIYLTVLLVLGALSLFLFTAVAGRLWCGYACPQTVYTEIFLWIERKVEGDRNARMRLDRSAVSAEKLARKGAKHFLWIALSLWTGLTFVGYFTPIRELLTSSPGPWEAFWVLFYGFATYGNAGWMREQVCKYMCPYARFQSAMFDKDTLIITYDAQRGEPRGKGQGKGDCVDCGICVQVCPTGIDIRNGLQYECIGCAACIDGCDQVMDKVERPRVIVYSLILLLIAAGAAVSLYLRTPLKVDVIRDRAALAREVEGGLIENVYRLQIMNTAEEARAYEIRASGLPGILVWGESVTGVPAATSRMVPVRVRIDAGPAAGSYPIEFSVTALGVDGVEVREPAVFIVR